MRPGVKQAGFDRAKAAILAALQVEPELRGLKDSLLIEEAPEGLRVQILDRDQLPMFPVGSDAMYPHTRRLLGGGGRGDRRHGQQDLAARAHRFPAVRRGLRPGQLASVGRPGQRHPRSR